VYTIAVQNALPYSRLGVVTSSVQFTRSIGSTIGVSVLGTIVADVYAKSFAQAQPAPLKRLLATAAARGHPVPTDPQVLVNAQAQAAIQQGFMQLLGPQLGGTFYREFLAAVQTGLLDAIHASFIAMLVTGVLALIATLFLQEIPLRRSIRDTQAAPGDARAAPAATATAH
jgi:hypothetical protein